MSFLSPLPGDLRTKPGPRTLGTIRVKLPLASYLGVGDRVLLSTSLPTCGTLSHGPLWAMNLVWGFSAETVHRGSFSDPGGSGYTWVEPAVLYCALKAPFSPFPIWSAGSSWGWCGNTLRVCKMTTAEPPQAGRSSLEVSHGPMSGKTQ